MLVGMEEEEVMMMAAASSECSSGCQSGWTTYLDDHSSHSCVAAGFHGKARQPCYHCDDYSEEAEEDDLSMVSDASSGPRQQFSAGNDEGAAAAHANAHAERRGRRMMEPAGGRRQSKMAAVASLLEDTASSPAFFKYSKQAMSSAEANGYGGAAAPMTMMEIGNAADFSCAFSATTGFKSPLSGTPLGGYLQMQYSTAPVKPMSTRQVCTDGGDKIKRW